MMKKTYFPAARPDKHKILCVVIVIMLACICSRSIASEADPVNSADKEFLTTLRNAVIQGKADKIAEYIKYPLSVNHGKSSEHTSHAEYIKTKEEFVARYDKIFTAKIKSAVVHQNPETLFKNWQGLMIGKGEIWCTEISPNTDSARYLIRIISVNLGD